MKYLLLLCTVFILIAFSCSRSSYPNIGKIDIYFLNLNLRTNQMPCERLKKITEYPKSSLIERKKIIDFMNAFNSFDLEKTEREREEDARVCIDIYDNQGTIIKTISLGGEKFIFVDGKSYKGNKEFFNYISDLLGPDFTDYLPDPILNN